MNQTKSAENDPERVELIRTFLKDQGWIRPPFSVSFLAAGEYNANYLVESAHSRQVLRINHGSQLGLGHYQIQYELNVLKALEDSGVTPKAFFCHPDPEPLGGGALLMEFLPGEPLDYTRDLNLAAHIFARVHAQPVSDALIVQANPVKDIAKESFGLIHRFEDHPRVKEKNQILAYYDQVMELAETTRPLFKSEALCIVNTEVNSGNFLIHRHNGVNEDLIAHHSVQESLGRAKPLQNQACLVDWEKAVVSCRYQDLGHFIVPTTTLWKTDVCLDAREKRSFLKAYGGQACPEIPLDELVYKTQIMEQTILLRALSWCFMAWYEYTHKDRQLTHALTFKKIEHYLSDIPWILNCVA